MKHHHFPAHHHSHRNLGESLVGMPAELLNGFLASPDEFTWLVKKIINEGPPSKQVRNAFLLKELSQLVNTAAILSGNNPASIAGIEIEADEPESEGYTYPIHLPAAILEGMSEKEYLISLFQQGPPHDVARDIILLAAMNWLNQILTGTETVKK